MSKSSGRSKAVPYIGGTLIWAYMSLLVHTMRWRTEGLENMREAWEGPDPFVLATWHSRILLMPYLQIKCRPRWKKAPQPEALMVANSKDGEFTKRAGTLLGLKIIRGGAPTKGKGKLQGKRGVSAAREAMEVMAKGGGIVITIDGPRGPAEEVGIGAVKLAQQMSAPILVYGLSANCRRLKTWDRLLFPGLFARGAVVIPPPIPTSKDMDSEALRQEVERQLKAATARADMLAGLKDEPVVKAQTAQPAPAQADDPALERTGS